MRSKRALSILCAFAIALCAFIPNAQSASGAATAPDPRPPFSTCTIDEPGASKSWDVPVSFTYVKPKMDIMYVFDTTGSMRFYRSIVAESVNAFNAELVAAGATDIWWGAAYYGDADSDAIWFGIELPLDSYPLETVQSKICDLTPTLGGDEPEDTLASFMLAIDETPWRPYSQHVIVVITDATTKLRPELSIGASYHATYEDAAALAREKGIVTCLMDYKTATLPEMASALGVSEHIWVTSEDLKARLRTAVIEPVGKTYNYSTAIVSSRYQSDSSPSSDVTVVPSPARFALSGGESKHFSFDATTANPPARYNDTTVVEIGFFVDGVRIPSATQYVNYRVNRYSVTYSANTTDTTSPLEPSAFHQANSAVSVAPALTRKGYSFISWNTAENGSGTEYREGSVFPMPAKDLDLYAIWQIGSNKVVYDPNTTDPTSALPATLTYEFGSPVTIQDSIARTGYTFVDWNTSEDGTGTAYQPEEGFTMPDDDVTLHAIWKVNAYNLTYFANTTDRTSNVPVQSSHVFNTAVTVEKGLDRKGYAFVCWNTAADRSGMDISAEAVFEMPASDLELYAVWKIASPNTSDTTHATLYLTLLAVSFAMLIGGLVLINRKRAGR